MPSTLYESVKKSVIEFAELRKKNEKMEDKLVFKWKLITLGLSILFIILIGGFSQILKAVNSLPD
jgi:polyferredoxin